MSGGRADRLVSRLAELELDALIVGDLVRPGDSGRDAVSNLRWLTGFSGTSGLAVVGADVRVLITDFRYAERAEREVFDGFDKMIAERELIPAAVDAAAGTGGLRRRSDERQEPSPARGAGRRRAGAGPGRAASWRRSAAEGGCRAGCDRRGGAGGRSGLRVGIRAGGRGAQRARDHARRPSAHARAGRRGPSFPAIVGAGENSSIPHHDSSGRKVGPDELLLIDMGAIVDGYCSDCTRTVATGDLDDEASEAYELVRSAQQGALDAIRPGSGPGTRTRRHATGSRPPAWASGSATAWGTASAWRSTRPLGCRESPITRSRLETS